MSAAEILADQKRSGVLPRLLGEALGEREEIPLGKVEVHALDAVHGKEDDAGSEGLAIFDLCGQIIESRDIDAAQAEAFARKLENRTPEFFARVGQGGDYECARTKRANGLGILIKACTGHDSIVVWEAGKLQTERYYDRNVRDAQEFTVKLRYLHRNPVKRHYFDSHQSCHPERNTDFTK